ncbi:TPA: YitT family protein [Streptococcus suis]
MKKINDYLNMETSAIIFSLVLITIGCAVYALGVNSVVIPNKFASGGVAGIAILVYYMANIPAGLTNLVLNALLIIIGWRYLEKKTLIFTLYALFMTSIFLDLFIPPTFTASNVIITAVAGGAIMGVGLGLILRGNGTSAGTDVIALMMRQHLGISFSLAVFILNLLIISLGSFVIGLENAIVTLMMKYLSSAIIDFFTEGFNRRKSLMIISDRQEEVAQAIIEKLGRGLTVFKAYGYYSHKEKDVLYVIVSRNQMVQIQKLIATIDPVAFVTVSDVQQVIGQGFTFFNPTNRNKRFYS